MERDCTSEVAASELRSPLHPALPLPAFPSLCIGFSCKMKISLIEKSCVPGI